MKQVRRGLKKAKKACETRDLSLLLLLSMIVRRCARQTRALRKLDERLRETKRNVKKLMEDKDGKNSNETNVVKAIFGFIIISIDRSCRGSGSASGGGSVAVVAVIVAVVVVEVQSL